VQRVSPWSKAQRLPKQRLRIVYDDGAVAWEAFPADGIKLLEPRKSSGAKGRAAAGAGGAAGGAAAAAVLPTAAEKEDRWLEAIFLAERGSRDAFVFKYHGAKRRKTQVEERPEGAKMDGSNFKSYRTHVLQAGQNLWDASDTKRYPNGLLNCNPKGPNTCVWGRLSAVEPHKRRQRNAPGGPSAQNVFLKVGGPLRGGLGCHRSCCCAVIFWFSLLSPPRSEAPPQADRTRKPIFLRSALPDPPTPHARARQRQDPAPAGTLLTIDYGGQYNMDTFLHMGCFPSTAEGARQQQRYELSRLRSAEQQRRKKGAGEGAAPRGLRQQAPPDLTSRQLEIAMKAKEARLEQRRAQLTLATGGGASASGGGGGGGGGASGSGGSNDAEGSAVEADVDDIEWLVSGAAAATGTADARRAPLTALCSPPPTHL